MILVMDPEKPFEYTPKGTIRRESTLRKYADDINQLYDITEASTSSEIPQPVSLNFRDVTTFVHAVVWKVLNRDIKNEDDIFRAGADRYAHFFVECVTFARVRPDPICPNVVYVPFPFE
jgi:hypothetical protein